ncbi:MAG TPA: hypothetical protein VGD99_13475, partial [Anaerolineae bacterium]
MTAKSPAKRFPNLLLANHHYSGTSATVLYNWPIFAGIFFFGVVTLSLGLLIAPAWSSLLVIVGLGSFAVITAILLATYLVYDRGQQREYDRLAELGRVGEANVVLDITAGKLRGTRGLLPHFKSG